MKAKLGSKLIYGLAGAVLAVAATLVSDKQQEMTIEKKVNEALNKKSEEDESWIIGSLFLFKMKGDLNEQSRHIKNFKEH